MSITRLSVNLSTNNPLEALQSIIPPRWDDLINYPNIIINLKGDSKMELTLYESSNERAISNEKKYIIDANSDFNIRFQLNARFFKLKLTNIDVVNQSTLNLQVIYTANEIIEKDSGSFKIWDNKTLSSSNLPSTAYNSHYKNSLFTFYGNSSASTVLTVQISNDGITWFNSQTTYTLTTAGNFGFTFSGVCNYIRLMSSSATTITTYLNYK